MILSGPAIQHAVEQGDIEIDPFRQELLNPASYDLCLGSKGAVYLHHFQVDPRAPIDVRDPIHFDVEEFDLWSNGFTLRPGVGYLLHTIERVHTKKFVPVLDGKSSIGRLFIQVHVTAGYGDPGFDGQYTLEVIALFPVRIYPGMRIAQIRFHTIEGPIQQYTGNYRGKASMGPVASKAWKQFER